MPPLSQILSAHTGRAPDREGRPAIRLSQYAEKGTTDPEDAGHPLGLVLTDGRLLQPVPGAVDLLPRLSRLVRCMQAEGIDARVVRVDLYDGTEHRDGEVVLALRDLLRDVRASYPGLRGVTFVGRFPHATILRRWPWAPAFAERVNGFPTRGRPYLAWEPEYVAATADVVLGDLTGRWDESYAREVTLPTLRILPGPDDRPDTWMQPGGLVRSIRNAWELEHHTYADVFVVDDGAVTIGRAVLGQTLTARIDGFRSDPEIAADTRDARNPLATPGIAVSRIDASHAAVRLGEAGHVLDRSPLDAAGRPQRFTARVPYRTFDVRGHAVVADEEFELDPVLERRLLAEHLDRNHAHRTGAFARRDPEGVALAHSFDPDDVARLLERAVPDVRSTAQDVGLARYASSWRTPALLRGIGAHSFERGSAFARGPAAPIADALGPAPFRWTATTDGGRFVYTPEAVASDLHTDDDPRAQAAELWLYRTLWQNRRIADQPALVLHGGCGVSTPSAFDSRSFTDPGFGRNQNAESLLFYTGSLAVVARSKAFDDDPGEFADALDGGAARLGTAWRQMFDAAVRSEPEGADLGEQAARCKKVYPWSLLGDWSITLRPAR